MRIPWGIFQQEPKIIEHQNGSPGDYYSQLNGSVWGALLPEEPPDCGWNVPGKWTLASLLLKTKTESIGPKPRSCTAGPIGCDKGTELCCTMRFPDACVCVDDRRERAQSESCICVNLSQNILWLLAPLLPGKAMVLGSGWQTEASGDVWLLRPGLWQCKKGNCFTPW